MSQQTSRRQLLAALPVAAAGVLTGARWPTPRAHSKHHHDPHHHGPRPQGHPDPRPGVDASGVLTAADLTDFPEVLPLYDKVREIPHIADGVQCFCGCASIPGHYSLLSCFEARGMARACDICQGTASMTYRLHHAGRTLDQIRRAVDARYG